MEDKIEKFQEIFNTSDIVKRWEAKGFDHVGTIFCGEKFDILFPMDGGIKLQHYHPSREISIDLEMLELIYETKKYILELHQEIEEKFKS